jgi:hypothetical protein
LRNKQPEEQPHDLSLLGRHAGAYGADRSAHDGCTRFRRESRRRTCATSTKPRTDQVGWVERSETHRLRFRTPSSDGFRKGLNPSYAATRSFRTPGGDGFRERLNPSYCPEKNDHIKIGDETYMRSGDGLLMPAKKDQRPPDLRYFKTPAK